MARTVTARMAPEHKAKRDEFTTYMRDQHNISFMDARGGDGVNEFITTYRNPTPFRYHKGNSPEDQAIRKSQATELWLNVLRAVQAFPHPQRITTKKMGINKGHMVIVYDTTK